MSPRSLRLLMFLIFTSAFLAAMAQTVSAWQCGPRPTAESDSAARFTLRIVKGLEGELTGEQLVSQGYYKNCPKVDELIAKSGQRHVIVQSSVTKLTTDQDTDQLELRFSFPLCQKAKQ